MSYYFLEPKLKSKTYYITLICILLFPFSSAVGFQATFTPRFSITEEHTDNYFLNENKNDPEYPDYYKKYEKITTISPGFTAQIQGKSSGAEISYDPSYAFHDEFSEDDTWRHSAQLSGWTDISRNNRLELNDSFMSTEDPISDVDPTIRRDRNLYYTNTASLGLTHQFGEADSINLGYEYSILENEAENIEDNARHIPSIGLTYWFVPRQSGFETNVSYTKAEFEISPPLDASDDLYEWYGSARLFKSYTRHFEGFARYAHTAVDYDGDTENFQIYNPSAGFNYSSDPDDHIEDDLSLSFEFGFYFLEREVEDNEADFTASGNLTKIFRRGSFNITGSYGYELSYFGAENLGFSKFNEAGVSATYQLARHISGNIFVSNRNNKYPDIYLQDEREDKTTRGGFGITIQPLTWMSIELNYTYRSVDSTLVRNCYEENRGLIRITLSSPLPPRTSQE